MDVKSEEEVNLVDDNESRVDDDEDLDLSPVGSYYAVYCGIRRIITLSFGYLQFGILLFSSFLLGGPRCGGRWMRKEEGGQSSLLLGFTVSVKEEAGCRL